MTQDANKRNAQAIFDELCKWLADVERTLTQFEDLVEADNQDVLTLRDVFRSVREDGPELLEQGRLLRLGIVGQVKAGKSSLLNALLFEGREVLPKAATPMTASLTHIVRSDKDEIEVEYYGRDDWDEICTRAAQYQESVRAKGQAPESMRASYEIVQMVKDRDLDVGRYLGTADCHATPVDTLNKSLTDLVGTNGALTPLVKSVTIKCSQGIPEIDIVDTPGINDPVLSRSQQADKLLSRCDAVLLLSYAGQFMDSEDAAFFQWRLPTEGISRRLLIGSKFDSALVDVGRDFAGDLDEALKNTRKRLAEHARQAFHRTSDAGQTEVMSDEVFFVSAVCANLARKTVREWTDEERETFERIRKAYPDWLDPLNGDATDETRTTLASLGNLDEVEEYLANIRDDKERIMLDKLGRFLREKRSSAEEEVREIVKDLCDRRKELREGDPANAKARIDGVRAQLNEVSCALEDEWGDLAEEQKSLLRNLSKRIHEEINSTNAAIRDARKLERVEKPGAGGWVRRNIFGADSGWTEEENEDTNQVQAAADDWANYLEHDLKEAAEELFSSKFVRNASKGMDRVVLGQLDNALAANVDTSALKSSIRRAVKGVARTAKETIKSRLPEFDRSEVSSQKDARQTVRAAAKAANKWIDNANKAVAETIERAVQDLVPAAVKQIDAHAKRLEKDLARREFSLQRYDLAVAAIQRVGKLANGSAKADL